MIEYSVLLFFKLIVTKLHLTKKLFKLYAQPLSQSQHNVSQVEIQFSKLFVYGFSGIDKKSYFVCVVLFKKKNFETSKVKKELLKIILRS